MRTKFSRESYLESLIAAGIIHRKDPGDGGDGGGGGGEGEGEEGEPKEGEGGEGEGEGGEPKKPAGDEKPTDKEAELLKDVMKHKAKAKTALAEAELVKTELQKLKSALGDKSVEDIQKMISDARDAERKEAEKRGEYDRILKQVNEENKTKLDAVNAELATANKNLAAAYAEIEELTIGREFSDSEFVRENSAIPAGIARKEFGAYFDREDGRIVGFDKPRGASERTPLVDATGQPKPFNDAIKHLYEVHPEAKSLIKVKAKPGAQSKTATDGGKKPAPGASEARGLEKIRQSLSK